MKSTASLLAASSLLLLAPLAMTTANHSNAVATANTPPTTVNLNVACQSHNCPA